MINTMIIVIAVFVSKAGALEIQIKQNTNLGFTKTDYISFSKKKFTVNDAKVDRAALPFAAPVMRGLASVVPDIEAGCGSGSYEQTVIDSKGKKRIGKGCLTSRRGQELLLHLESLKSLASKLPDLGETRRSK